MVVVAADGDVDGDCIEDDPCKRKQEKGVGIDYSGEHADDYSAGRNDM